MISLKATVPINESVRQDVTVKFSGTACQEIRVWPVWATISNFRGDNSQGEPLSADNNPAATFSVACSGLGTPATCVNGTRNQMEMRATITPQGVSAIDTAGNSVQFDFRRTMERKHWAKNAADATWTLQLAVPSGTNDDPDNTDEDLHDKNDVIWVWDAPGVTAGAASHDFFALEWDFRESADLILNQMNNKTTAMSGQLISVEQQWHSILNLKKNATTGKWERNTDRTNRIRTGAITIGAQPQ